MSWIITIYFSDEILMLRFSVRHETFNNCNTGLLLIQFLYDLNLSTTMWEISCCRAQFPITHACRGMVCDNSPFILLYAGQCRLSRVYSMYKSFSELASLISYSDWWPVNSQILFLIFSMNSGDLCPTVQHLNTNIYVNDWSISLTSLLLTSIYKTKSKKSRCVSWQSASKTDVKDELLLRLTFTYGLQIPLYR